jgi:hypothetical protein
MIEQGYERSGIDARRVLYSMAALAATIAVACLTVWALLQHLSHGETQTLNSPAVDPQSLPPSPRLEPVAGAALHAYWREQQASLHTYGWIDPDAGVVQIPIERAMELRAQRP